MGLLTGRAGRAVFAAGTGTGTMKMAAQWTDARRAMGRLHRCGPRRLPEFSPPSPDGSSVSCPAGQVVAAPARSRTGFSRRRGPFALVAVLSLWAAACGDGATEPAPPPATPNRAPAQSGSIPAQTIHVGESATVNLSSSFNDPDGDALTYTATSSDAGVATVTVSGSTVTVTAVTQGMATVTVTARDPGGLSAQQSFTVTVPNREPEVLVTVEPLTITSGEAARFSPPVAEWFSDPDGDPLTHTASSSNDGVAVVGVVDGDLIVGSVAEGTATITVSATDPGGLSAELSFDITVTRASQEPVVITGVAPEVLVEGENATIMGTGFSLSAADNQVSIGGLPAMVTAVSDTSLSIVVPEADCQPPRRVELRVAIADLSDARTVGVTPGPPDDLIAYDGLYVTASGDGCIQLPGSEAGGEYLIGVVSTSEDVSSLTAVTLNGIPGDAAVAGTAGAVAALSGKAYTGLASSVLPRPVASRRPRPSIDAQSRLDSQAFDRPGRDYAAHNRIMARNEELSRRLGRTTLPSFDGTAGAVRSVEVGDTLTLEVSPSCSESHPVQAVVRSVGTGLVWLEDLDNPSGTFTDSELAELGRFYSDYTKGVHDDYFGGLPDVDGNGQVLILMTKETNRRERVFGYVYGEDLYPKSECSTSNEAEIFYGLVPDPDGSIGRSWTKEQVLAVYPALLTHEITHIVQFGARHFGSASANKATWELEGGATLSEQLVGYRLFGHGSGQNLGWTEFLRDELQQYYVPWLRDMVFFFGGGPEGSRIAGVPEECSWVGRPGEGNTGPCLEPQRAVYGVPAMLFRFMMDIAGDDYPGGEGALMRRMTQSPESGFMSLVDAASIAFGTTAKEEVLAGFYASLGLELLKDIDTLGMSSWDLYDIFSNLMDNLQLQPHMSDSASPQVEASIRAGSSLYFDWTPSGSLAPTSIKVTSPDGHISVWAVRVR